MEITTQSTKSHVVFEKVKKMIVSKKLYPGSRILSQRKLAEEFNVTENVMRNAFKLLENKKLIVRKRGSGTFVNPSLKYNGTKLVALLTSYHKQDIEGYFEPLFEAANSSDIIPIITTLDYKKDWQANISKVMAREPDAVMIDVEAKWFPMDELHKLINDTPCCFVNRWEWDNLEPTNAVLNDYVLGYGKALKQLKEHGHKKIIIFGHKENNALFLTRDFNNAAEIAGMSFDKELIYYSRDQLVKAEESLKAVYVKHKPTAIFGISDSLIDFIVERGIKVCPEICKLEKIGFYNLKISNIPRRKFSTVKLDFEQMWETTFNILNSNNNFICKIEPELIQR